MQEVPQITPAQQLYEDSCKELGRDVLTIDAFSKLPEEERQAFLSLYKIVTAIKAKKKGKKADYSNSEQFKRYPWGIMKSSGSGFSLRAVRYGGTVTAVGARLSSLTAEDAREVFEVMTDDYNNWWIE